MTLRRVFFFALTALFAAGCSGLTPGAVGPAGSLGGEPASNDEDPSALPSAASPSGPAGPSSPAGISDPGAPPPVNAGFSGSPGPVPHELLAAGDTPQAGGVSALPGAVEGGEAAKTAFDFTLTGEARPVCTEPGRERTTFSVFPVTHYFIDGEVGAALLDGTDVPLSGCEVVMLRFQTGNGNAVHCQDIPVKADCSLFGGIKLRTIDKPKVYFLTTASMLDDCDDMEDAHFPSKNELTFLAPAEKLPECKDPVLNESALTNPNFRSKVLK